MVIMTRPHWKEPEPAWSYRCCPFCKNDPYHYVHNGLGHEAVAVDCCELGYELYMPKGDKRVKRVGYLLGSSDKRRDRRGQRLLKVLVPRLEAEWEAQ